MRAVINGAYLGVVALALVGAACRETAAPVVRILQGAFPLARVNGRALPDTEAITFSGAPWNRECAILGTSGRLVLDRDSGRFTITMNARNACVDQEYLYLTEGGTYTQIGDSLSLIERDADSAEVLSGKIDARVVVVHSSDHDYEFTR